MPRPQLTALHPVSLCPAAARCAGTRFLTTPVFLPQLPACSAPTSSSTGTPRAASPPTRCSSRAGCACAGPPGSPGEAQRPATICTRWRRLPQPPALLDVAGRWDWLGGQGCSAPPAPGAGLAARGPVELLGAEADVTARPPWATAQMAGCACSAACSRARAPAPGGGLYLGDIHTRPGRAAAALPAHRLQASSAERPGESGAQGG